MNIVKTLTLGVVLIALTGCSAIENKIGKFVDGATSSDYRITQWSGGVLVKTWEIKSSFVNSEQETDGYFFYYNGKLVRVSGTVTIEEM